MGNWLNTQWEWIKSFLSEPDGKASMKRLVSILVSVVFAVTYIKVAIFTVRAGSQIEMIDIPLNWGLIITGIIGLGIVDRIQARKSNEPNGK